jgi:putative transposase
MSNGRNRSAIPVTRSNMSLWPAPDISVFTKDIRAKYETRREILKMYADGSAYKDIFVQCGVKKGEILRLIKRCLTTDQTGKIFGFYALLPSFRVRAYTRTASFRAHSGGRGGFVGALSSTFERFPELEEEIQSVCLGPSEAKATMRNRSFNFIAVHTLFKERLTELGVTSLEWPFNTDHCGAASLRKYCKKFIEGNAGSGSGNRGKAALGRHTIGRGVSALIKARTPFTIVQLDYHKVDAASTISIENEFGESKDILVQRWHIGLLADEKTGGIIGAHVALETTPSADDALETIASAIIGEGNTPILGNQNSPQRSKPFLIRHFLPELNWQCFAAIKMDNGWANLANDVVDNLISVVGCAVNFGPVRAW